MMDTAPGPDEIDGDLAEGLRARVKSELEPGERLLWTASPVEKSTGPGTRFLLALMIAGGSFVVSIFSFVFAIRSGPGQDGAVVLCVFSFALGFFFSVGILASLSTRRSERFRRVGTLYALTERRAIIWSPEPFSEAVKIVTIPRGSVSGVHRVEYPDGSGDVLFQAKGQGFQLGAESWGQTGFRGVAEVRRVEEQVRRTLIASEVPPAGT